MKEGVYLGEPFILLSKGMQFNIKKTNRTVHVLMSND